ncbi:MAG TPA: acetyl-CoA C-acyltransferase, partial [Myxococcota bacterium]|nr:acetyl-CoA C-acyltransferase [Myxococcota bacterium]
MPKAHPRTEPRRAAIVAGLRTPFVKASTVFKKLSAVQLATSLVAELVARTDIDPGVIERVVYGQVVISPSTPNIAREVALAANLPRTCDAYSVSRACATSTQALVEGAMAIQCGDIDVAIVGGADSLSRPPITYQDNFIDALMAANAAKDPLAKARPFLELKPKDLVPKPPALREVSTGLTMGESAEKMAKENEIPRADQDAFAYESHRRAAAAWEKGIYEAEVMHLPVPPSFETVVSRDAMVRADTSVEKLATLKPVFDARYGSVTAGNSSPLTDGASALLVMEEGRARALGFEPLAFVRSWAFAAVDPAWQLLMGPAIAIPRALERAEVGLDDIDLVDMHEAFAAQVLSNLQALASRAWMEKHVGKAEAVGEVPREKLNIYGGSISLGHPFAATGARQALTMARELER